MSSNRLQGLDSLRGIAALGVVIYHYTYYYNTLYGHDFEVPEFLKMGSAGVLVFFIISGFVIFLTLNRAKTPADFVFSRFSRLYPAYWAAVIITYSVVQLFGPHDREVGLETFFLNLTMFHEYFGYAHVDGVYWTLEIELMFYILCLGALISTLHKFPIVICFFWLALSLIHALSDFEFGIFEQIFLLDYGYLFAMGIGLYLARNDGKIVAPLLIIGVGVYLLWNLENGYVATFTTIGLAIIAVSALHKADWLSNSILLWLGSVSYTLYLVHQNIGYSIINACKSYGWNSGLGAILAFMTALVLAQCLTKYVEQPALVGLRRWYNARSEARLRTRSATIRASQKD